MSKSTAISTLPKALSRMPAPLKKALKELDIDGELAPDGMDAEACFQQAVKGVQSSFVRVVYAGWWFRRAKALANGERAWIDARAAEIGVGKSAIYDAMRLSECADNLDPKAFQRYTQIEYSKVTHCLRQFLPEEMNALANGDTVHGITFDELATDSRREIETKIREAENADLARKLKKTERDKIDLAEQLKTSQYKIRQLMDSQIDPSLAMFPDDIHKVRLESAALAERALLSVEGLNALYIEHSQLWPLMKGDAKQEGYWFLGAGAIYFQLRGILAEGDALLRSLEAELPEEAIGRAEFKHIFTAEEAINAAKDREMILNAHSADKARREQNRKGGKVRPRASTKKKGKA